MNSLGEATLFRMTPDALWLMGFGLVPAVLACWLGTPAPAARGAWCFGAAASQLGALGVFGVQHGGFFLLSWEMMSLGGAVMILGERRSAAPGMPVLFMLGLLEVGAVALLVAVLLLAMPAQNLGFAAFVGGAAGLPVWLRDLIGVLLHLAGHALAKGALFLTADGVLAATGSYAIGHALLARRSAFVFGAGALFAGMSLAAMPPQAGFVSEWYVFQTVFQGFHLPDLAGRLTLALAGAGLALTAAIAFATFVKVLGIGLFGGGARIAAVPPARSTAAVGLLGAAVLALAVGMPVWLPALAGAASVRFSSEAPHLMHDGWLLVPLTASFAFISPSLLVIVMPLLALLPGSLLLLSARRYPIRRVPVWYGGSHPDPQRTATTALTFSNALRTFYSFIYRPRIETT